MQLIVLGLNHRTAPVEVREKFSLSSADITAGLENSQDYEPLQEAVMLSTCNRSELYVAVDDGIEGVSEAQGLYAAQQLLADMTGNSEEFDNFAEYIYTCIDEECVRHLFMVAASLDSLVLGEGQILSQVKHAYSIAKDAGATSTVLNLLFHRAITAGKRVRTETRIAFNAVSVSYAAAQLAKEIFDSLANCSVMLVGAGKMAELTAMHMASQGVEKLYVANRHLAKAESLAERFKGQALGLKEAFRKVQDIDIIITSTGAPEYVIRSKELAPLMAKRPEKPLVLIDIAVPRDVDPEVEGIPGVKLYNIDDLEAVVDENLQERQHEAKQAETIVEAEVELLLDRFRYLPFQPLLAALTEKAENIRAREVKRAMAKLPDMTPEERRVLDNMTHMIVRKLLREPMMKITSAAGQQHEAFFVRAMQNLFELDEKYIEEMEYDK